MIETLIARGQEFSLHHTDTETIIYSQSGTELFRCSRVAPYRGDIMPFINSLQ